MIFRKVRLLPRGLKHIYQKIFRGFSNKELWGLDYTITKWILPRLKAFKKYCGAGYPCNLSKEQWDEILDKIILAFELHLEDDFPNKEKGEKYREGMELFAEYYGSLWD